MGFKKFIISQIRKDTSEITSYTFTPVDGLLLPDFRAGSYIAVRMENVGDVASHMRLFSLTNFSNRKTFSISVMTMRAHMVALPNEDFVAPDGLFSKLIADRWKVGDEVELSAPFGNFLLTEARAESSDPIVFLAAGMGVAPLVSMTRSLLALGSKAQIYFIHAVTDSSQHAFREVLQDLVKKSDLIKYKVLYSNPSAQDKPGVNYDDVGKINNDVIKTFVGDALKNADFYICGDPLIKPALLCLKDLNVSPDRLNFEYFGPLGTGL